MAFLDAKHGDSWAIWEFRAEGTGYPDEAVYGRIRHYPWPDHHPPPFGLLPLIMASMRRWLDGGEDLHHAAKRDTPASDKEQDQDKGTALASESKVKKEDRVVVVHCKAGKGRSGSMACSYLVSHCGWKPEDALARFTERRMRPNFGAGVSIPSQLRWLSYVDRWTRGDKKYEDRAIEITEIHVWGLRHNVKLSVEGFVDEGKKIRTYHTFSEEESIVMEGDAPGGGGVMDLVSDMAGYRVEAAAMGEYVNHDVAYADIVNGSEHGPASTSNTSRDASPTSRVATRDASEKLRKVRNSLMRKVSLKRGGSSQSMDNLASRSQNKSSTISNPAGHQDSSTPSLGNNTLTDPPWGPPPSKGPKSSPTLAGTSEPGGRAVIFRAKEAINIPHADANIAVERRNRAPASLGLTMVTSVAHVWFNAFFEGRGPEQGGKADGSGVFEIDWEKMDGIKGSSQKGTRACDRLSVVWRFADRGTEEPPSSVEPAEPAVTCSPTGKDSPVPQMRPADWKGGNNEDPGLEKQLGLRFEDPNSAGVCKASSITSAEAGKQVADDEHSKQHQAAQDDDDVKGVKTSGPTGAEVAVV